MNNEIDPNTTINSILDFIKDGTVEGGVAILYPSECQLLLTYITTLQSVNITTHHDVEEYYKE